MTGEKKVAFDSIHVETTSICDHTWYQPILFNSMSTKNRGQQFTLQKMFAILITITTLVGKTAIIYFLQMVQIQIQIQIQITH